MSTGILVVQGLLGLAFLGTGIPKFLGVKFSVAMRDTLAVPAWFWRFTGAVEVIGAVGIIVGIWVPLVASLAALLLAATMIGAATTHLTRGDSPQRLAPAAIMLIMALVVAAAYLPTLARYV